MTTLEKTFVRDNIKDIFILQEKMSRIVAPWANKHEITMSFNINNIPNEDGKYTLLVTAVKDRDNEQSLFKGFYKTISGKA